MSLASELGLTNTGGPMVSASFAGPKYCPPRTCRIKSPVEFERYQQEARQSEVTKVVRAELELVAVIRFGVGNHHDPCVVDQQVEGRVLFEEPFGERVQSRGRDRSSIL